LKDGVGKTTITINLAAHYAIAKGLRVLIIDFDYQGSLTATALNAAKAMLGSAILAETMLGGDVNGRWMVDVPRDLAKILPNTRLITCGQIFDRFENQSMMRWLIGDIEDDVRYRLARLVVSPEVQDGYDLILIDAPPRTSLGAVNALSASHALLVPTVPDSLSVDAVGRFLARMTKLRGMAPALTDVLVVPSLTRETKLRKDEIEALQEAKVHLSNWSGGALVTDTFIRHFPTLARTAGREIGYLVDSQYIRPAFEALANEVAAKLKLESKEQAK
jgi:cellulose biosynthesis protein BcsQ